MVLQIHPVDLTCFNWFPWSWCFKKLLTTSFDFRPKSLHFLLDGRIVLSGPEFSPSALFLDFKVLTVALKRLVMSFIVPALKKIHVQTPDTTQVSDTFKPPYVKCSQHNQIFISLGKKNVFFRNRIDKQFNIYIIMPPFNIYIKTAAYLPLKTYFTSMTCAREFVFCLF